MKDHKCNIENIEWDGELEIGDGYVAYKGTCSICGKEIKECHNLDNPEYVERDEEGFYTKIITLERS